jgi:hypothetical protein
MRCILAVPTIRSRIAKTQSMFGWQTASVDRASAYAAVGVAIGWGVTLAAVFLCEDGA